MAAHLNSLNMPVAHLPLVVQFNKQDLPDALPGATLRNLLKINGRLTIESVAITGQGVFETFKTIVNSVVKNVQRQVA
jgi:hypothetical protein